MFRSCPSASWAPRLHVCLRKKASGFSHDRGLFDESSLWLNVCPNDFITGIINIQNENANTNWDKKAAKEQYWLVKVTFLITLICSCHDNEPPFKILKILILASNSGYNMNIVAIFHFHNLVLCLLCAKLCGEFEVMQFHKNSHFLCDSLWFHVKSEGNSKGRRCIHDRHPPLSAKLLHFSAEVSGEWTSAASLMGPNKATANLMQLGINSLSRLHVSGTAHM